jgi:hypothetical protein
MGSNGNRSEGYRGGGALRRSRYLFNRADSSFRQPGSSSAESMTSGSHDEPSITAADASSTGNVVEGGSIEQQHTSPHFEQFMKNSPVVLYYQLSCRATGRE